MKNSSIITKHVLVVFQVKNVTTVRSLDSVLVVAAEAGVGGKVLEDPGAEEGLAITLIPPKLYCMLRIPPAAGLTARAIPVA